MAAQIDCSCEDGILPDGELPGDVMVSILLYLPVKSLSRFKTVSKPWCSFISSPPFIKSHLRRHSLIPNNFLFSCGDYGNCSFGLLAHNHDKKRRTSDRDVLILESPPLFSSMEQSLNIIDSCNGLVCVAASFGPFSSWGLILWNPATRKHRSLELPNGDYHLSVFTLGLCYVEASNDFKIVGWTDTHNPANRPSLFVYSLNSDSWEKFDYNPKNSLSTFESQSPTFLMGCMHWLAKTCTCEFVCACSPGKVIVAFDVMDGVMSCFDFPDGHGFHSGTLMQTLVSRGCLSIVNFPDIDAVVQCGFEVWVMEEYGVKGSWVKRFTFQGWREIGFPIISWSDGEIVFAGKNQDSNTLTFYDPVSKEEYCLNFESFYVYQVSNYVESLASVEGGGGSEIAPFPIS